MGAIIDEPRYFDHLTGRENLEVNPAARAGGAAARIPEALDRVGLSYENGFVTPGR